ncbi:MAG TPA: glycosyltransferase [Chitinivibrionales bacterium]|nr:glycosyltransferase [Chitinivibrionales bacterium]
MIVYKPIAKTTYDVCIIHLADARFYPFFHRQAQALTENGYKVALVSWERNPGEADPQWPGIDVYPICIRSDSIRGKWYFIRYFFSLTVVLCRLKARLYEAVDPLALLPARLAARRQKSRYNYFSLEYFQGIEQLVAKPIMRLIWRSVERFGVARARNVAAVCKTTEQLLRRDFGLLRTSVVLNVPARLDYAAAADGRLRRRIGIPPQTPLVIYKGEISENRGLLPFIAAMDQFEPLHFVLVGGGIYQERLGREAKQRGLDKRIHFINPVPSNEFVHYLKDANAGHAIHEAVGVNMTITLPSKLFDYINAGIPVFTGDGPEMSRIVKEWDVGWVVSGADVESIRQAIKKFLLSLSDAEKFRKNCARAAQKYCWENEKKSYLQFIEEAMG